MARPTVDKLIERFKNSECHPHVNNKLEVSAEKTIYLCLWYLSNKESFRTISDRFNVSLSSSHRILICAINFVISLCCENSRWPNHNEKKKKNKLLVPSSKRNIGLMV